jgi:ribosome-binding factor A
MKRIVRDAVADIILNRLSDPRLTGFVTITEIDLSPDIRNADIHISVMAETEGDRRKTFEAVKHATKHIQMLLGEQMSLRYALQLRILEDTKTKKTLETLKIIEQAAKEIRQKDALDQKDEEMRGE